MKYKCFKNVLYERSFEARNNIVTESAIEAC